MSVDLPDLIDPVRAAKAGLSLSGEIDLIRLPRLAAALVVERSEAGGEQARFGLVFGLDGEGRTIVQGWVCARLHVRCQRCLGELEIQVDAPLRLGLALSDQAARDLPDDLDPLVVEEELIRPLDLIEDELLLAIPAVPRHAPGDCLVPVEQRRSDGPGADLGGAESRSGPDGGERHPFAVLEALKRGRGD